MKDNIVSEAIDKFEIFKECIKIDFSSDEWRKNIPSESGWYIIKTDTPINILKELPKPKGTAHYNINKRVELTLNEEYSDFLITQKNTELYVVYNGHAANLKSRAREHDRGHNKTGCLSLRQYEILHNYDWYFCFLPVSSLSNIFDDDKIFRLAVEQAWRYEFGWPVLCKG